MEKRRGDAMERLAQVAQSIKDGLERLRAELARLDKRLSVLESMHKARFAEREAQRRADR